MTAAYLYGETWPVSPTFDTTDAIAIGDLCWQDSSDSYQLNPASEFTWNTDLATTQAEFVLAFLGVAAQSYDGTTAGLSAYGIKDGKIRVACDGVYEFDTASASYVVGQLVGPAKQSGNALENQKVASVASEALAIGRVVEETSSATKVKVRIFSRRMRNAWPDATVTANSLDGSEVGNTDTTEGVVGGIPVIHVINASTLTGDVDVTLTHKTRVIDVWCVATAAGGAGDTITVSNGATAITDAMDLNVSDKVVVRAGTIDDASHAIAAAGTLKVTGASGANAIVYVKGIRVA